MIVRPKGYTTHRSKVVVVYKDGVRVAVYTTMSNAARGVGVAVQNIWRALNGYKTTLKGYEFRLEEEVE